MRYFKAEEFYCCESCEKGIESMDEELLRVLDLVRMDAGIPLYINSSIRCQSKNKAVGGYKTSSHLGGFAVDLKCENSVDRLKIIEALVLVGVGRFAIGDNFVHFDVDPNKVNCVWVY